MPYHLQDQFEWELGSCTTSTRADEDGSIVDVNCSCMQVIWE